MFLLLLRFISGGRSGNKRRQHGHRIHNKAGGAVNSLGDQGKHGGQPELQAIDPNAPTPPPHRRGPRRHSNGKSFVWKQVGFSECSKTCGGGEPTTNQFLNMTKYLLAYFELLKNGTGMQQALIVCVRDRDQAPVADHRCKEDERPPSETVRCSPKPCPAE